jgi:hypothetical protein
METGKWAPVELEKHLLAAVGSIQKPERTLRRLAQGVPLSKPGVMSIQRALKNGAVLYWANHPIFHLLDLRPNDPQFDLVLSYSLNSISGEVRDHFWPAAQSGSSAGSADITTAQIPDISSLRNALRDRKKTQGLQELDWFVLGLVTFTQAQRSRNPDVAWNAAFVTNEAFEAAVILNPPLLASWRDLADLLAAQVWDPVRLAGIYRTAAGNLPDRLQRFVRDQVDTYPPELLSMAGV